MTTLPPNTARFTPTAASLAALALLALPACSESDIDSPTDPEVTLTFAAQAGDVPFACGAVLPALGSTQVDVVGADLRLYAHDFELLAADGTAVPVALSQDPIWQTENVVLLDFEDGSGPCLNGNAPTNAQVVGTAPLGTYNGVRFQLGVPALLNHADASTANPPLSFTSMFWSWMSGYKYVRFEGETLDGSALRFHLGATQCDGEPGEPPVCQSDNMALIEVTGFDPLTNPVTLDLAALLADVDLSAVTDGVAMSCMSEPQNDACAPLLNAVGVDAQQSVFRAPQ